MRIEKGNCGTIFAREDTWTYKSSSRDPGDYYNSYTSPELSARLSVDDMVADLNRGRGGVRGVPGQASESADCAVHVGRDEHCPADRRRLLVVFGSAPASGGVVRRSPSPWCLGRPVLRLCSTDIEDIGALGVAARSTRARPHPNHTGGRAPESPLPLERSRNHRPEALARSGHTACIRPHTRRRLTTVPVTDIMTFSLVKAVYQCSWRLDTLSVQKFVSSQHANWTCTRSHC